MSTAAISTQTPTIAKPRRLLGALLLLADLVDDRLAVGLGGLRLATARTYLWSGADRVRRMRAESTESPARTRDRHRRRRRVGRGAPAVREGERRASSGPASAGTASGAVRPGTSTAAAERARHERPRARRPRPARRTASGRSGRRAAPGRRPRGRRTRTGRPSSARTSAAAPGPSSPAAAPGRRGRGRRRTGRPPSLPCASSAAPAISSATAGAVTASSLPWASMRPGEVLERRRSPAAPIAMSVWPSRQARPAVSVTTTPTLRPVRSRRAGAQAAGRGVGVDRQQHDRAERDVGGVDAGRGHGQAVVGAHDRGRAAAGDDAGGLAGAARRRACAAHDPALGLADDLAGDHDDVAVGEVDAAAAAARPGRRPRATSATPSGAMTESMPLTGDQLDRGRGHRRGRVVVGHHQRHGAAGDAGGLDPRRPGRRRGRRPASRRARRRRSRGRRSGARPPPALTSTPIEVSIWSAMPRTWVPPTMGERPTTGARVAPQRLADAGDAEDRADRDDRVGRRQDDQVGVGDRLDHAGRRRRRRRARPRPRSRPGPRRAAAPSTPGSARPGGRSASSGSAIATWVSTRSSVIGSSRTLPRRREPALAQRLGHLRERVAGVEHLGADQVGGDVAVAQAEPRRLDAVRRQLVLDAPRLVAPAPARGRGRCRRRGCTSRCRGRGRP